MRRYIRHPASIPIEFTVGERPPERVPETRNIGECGIAFCIDRELAAGTFINLRIPLVNPPFETVARVVWCHARANGYETGVEFVEPDQAYSARMCEQVCHIENYRAQVRATEGRELTPEEAAAEWVAKFASRFPRTG
jgi:hypothetical protein